MLLKRGRMGFLIVTGGSMIKTEGYPKRIVFLEADKVTYTKKILKIFYTTKTRPSMLSPTPIGLQQPNSPPTVQSIAATFGPQPSLPVWISPCTCPSISKFWA